MSEEKKIANWDDLEAVEDASIKVVSLPATSQAIGHELFAKVKAIDPVDLIGALNFPMDEVNQLVAGEMTDDGLGTAIKEHTSTMDLSDLLKAREAVVALGLVEPDPGGGNVNKLKADFNHLFSEIVALTMPAVEVNEAATFPANGEQ